MSSGRNQTAESVKEVCGYSQCRSSHVSFRMDYLGADREKEAERGVGEGERKREEKEERRGGKEKKG